MHYGKETMAVVLLLLGASVPRARAEDGCCGQPDHRTREAQLLNPAGDGSDVARELRTLERAAGQRIGVSTTAIRPEQYRQMVKAAHDYAQELAGNDNAKFAALATSALQQAVAVQMGVTPQTRAFESAQPFAFDAAADAMPPRPLISVWDQSVFQDNFRKLMDLAAQGDDLTPLLGPASSSIVRIVGPGTREARDGEFPDCVCVGRRAGSSNSFCCTGTLVGRNVVVTAGHCLFCASGGANAVVFVGNSISGTGKTYQGTIHRHPEYGQDGKHHDLSAIVLNEDVEGVTPRKIASTEQINQATFVRAVGFGNSDFASTQGFGVKRLVDIPVASIACNGPQDPQDYECDQDLELVAGFIGLGPDSCNGDSGGPVYILLGNDARIPEAWHVAGATSRATRGATRPCGDGGIYLRLDKYSDFIRNLPNARL